MTDLGGAINDYTTSVLGAIGPMALVAAVALACILVLYGLRR